MYNRKLNGELLFQQETLCIFFLEIVLRDL